MAPSMHAAMMRMPAFEFPEDKALPDLPSPILTNPDLVLPSLAHCLPVLLPTHATPPSPTYLLDTAQPPALPPKEKRGLMSRKMMLLRSQTNSNSDISLSQPWQHGDHPSISTIDDHTAIPSSPTLTDVGKLVPEPSRSSGSSVTSEELVGMPAFLAKYHASEDDKKEEDDDDDDETVGDSATVIEDGVEAQRQQQEKAEQASAILSKRAEQILANAKKRLNVMEGNLRGARDLVAPLTAANLKRATSLGSIQASQYAIRRHQTESPAQPAQMLHSQASSPTMSKDYQGHARNFSANSVHDRAQPSLARQGVLARNNRIPVKVNTSSVNQALKSSRSNDSFGNNVAIYHAVSRDRPPQRRTSPDSPLGPLHEDNTSVTDADSDHTETRDFGLARHSPSVPEDLRSQMSTLKGKISSLKDRAREDSLRRRSLLNLKITSPFNNAAVESPELFYTPAQELSASPLETGSRNAFAERAAAEKQQRALTPTRAQSQEHERQSSASSIPAPKSQHQRTPSGSAIIQSAKKRFSHHQYHTSNGSWNSANSKSTLPRNLSGRFVESVADGEDRSSGSGQSLATAFEVRDIDGASEDGESVYEDAEDVTKLPAVAHEDRDDAFDYEHFFLHSAMGIYSKPRRDSTSSDGSVSSAGTARGPGAAALPEDEEDDESLYGDGRFRPSPHTPERLREIERNLHYRTRSAESFGSDSTFATAHESAGSRPLSRVHPDSEWPIVTSPSQSHLGTAIRRTIPSDTSSDRADSGVGGLPPRSQSAAEASRKSPPRVLRPSRSAKFNSTASAMSPPMSPLDPATVAVNALLNPDGPQLGLKDKVLLFSLVDALRITCQQMQEAEDGQTESLRLRRRLEAVRRAIDDADAAESFDSSPATTNQ